MNDLIRKLAEQCTTQYQDGNGGYIDQVDTEKFAELIVKECCEVAHCNFHVDGLTLGTILKEHFGVSE